ncbi:PRC-barrel domain-containing protein [Tropicimonas aquimaris]|uniref:PRC-barrel domain-containing protein n=1 Tax=Tropicimonas aquimaris TaxID=914152 RepID=A0ABW3IXL3_9RHOB
MTRMFLGTVFATSIVLPMVATAQMETDAPRPQPGAMHTEMPSAVNGEGVPMHTEFLAAPSAQSLEASDLIGARVYVAEEVPVDQPVVDIVDNWDDVGEVGDILIARDGRIEAALVDVGGFLGIGEKTVAVGMPGLDIVAEKDGSGWFVVFAGDRASLEGAPEYEAAEPTREAMADDMPAEDTARAEQPPEHLPQTWQEDGVFVAPAPDMEARGFTLADRGALTADRLTGAPVYDGNNEHVGELGELVLAEDGQIETGVIDVGGFLGIGEKPVAVDYESMSIATDDLDRLTVHVDLGREQLEQLPEFEG